MILRKHFRITTYIVLGSLLLNGNHLFSQSIFDKYTTVQTTISEYLSIDSLNNNAARKISSEIWYKSLDINEDDIEGFFNRAVDKMKQNLYLEAILDIDKILQIDTSISLVYSLKGYCLLLQDNPDAALSNINKALQIDGSNGMAYYTRGRYHYTKNQYQKAKPDFQKALELNSKDPESNYFLGTIALSEGDLPLAKSYFKKSIEIEPQFVEPYIGLCSVFIYSGQKLNALKILEDASKYLDGNSNYYLVRGNVQFVFGNYQKAIDDFNTCLKGDSLNYQALLTRGIIQIVLKNFSEGFTDIQHAILDSTYINKVLVTEKVKEAFFFRTNSTKAHLLADFTGKEKINEMYASGFCKYITGDYEGAFRDLSLVIQSDKMHFEPYELRGKIQVGKWEFDLAESDFESALKLSGGTFFSCINLATINFKQEDTKNINKYLVSALKFEPENPEIYKILGEFNTSNPVVAITYYNKVMQLEPGNYNILLKNAVLKKNNGFAQESLKDYKKLVSENPRFNEGYMSMAELHTTLNELDSAKLCLKEACRIDSANYEPFLMLARIYAYEKDHSNAIYYYWKAKSRYNTFVISLELGGQYQFQQNYKEAIKEYNYIIKTLKGFPSDKKIVSEAYYNTGICHDSLSDKNNALKNYTLAIETEPQSAIYYYSRGEVLRRMKKYDLSLIDFSRSISLDSLFLLSYISIGKQYSETSDVDKAIDYFKKAIDIDSIYFVGFLETSKAYFSKHDFINSCSYAKTAMNIDSLSTEASYYLWMSTLNLGDSEESKKTFLGFIELNCRTKFLTNDKIKDYLNSKGNENELALELTQILIDNPCN